MKLFSFVALFGLFASSAVHLAVANGLPLPEWVFVLQLGILALAVPLTGTARQPALGARRLTYWSNAWGRSPIQLLLLTLLLIGYVVYESFAWLKEPDRGLSFLKLLSSAWMCAYAIESALLYSAAHRDGR